MSREAKQAENLRKLVDKQSDVGIWQARISIAVCRAHLEKLLALEDERPYVLVNRGQVAASYLDVGADVEEEHRFARDRHPHGQGRALHSLGRASVTKFLDPRGPETRLR